MSGIRIVLLAAAGLALTACDNGPSAVAQKPADERRSQTFEEPRRDNAGVETAEAPGDRRDTATPKIDGRPMWSSTRRYSAQENAERAFSRNGEAFGAADVDTFVRKAHAFVNSPPRGTLTLPRSNGDTLLYDPKGNVFAIRTAQGAPRTMFRPDDGMAYWEEQKAREARRSASRRGGDDDA
ncbi:hypothetical protein [Phenylobacterium sp. SCN 70-31]|uniref:hypothetical protein n=1 Tax=Phenylobacterium sp. SCN 70-31 TaxID=1660129 RepID=UPI00086AF9C7|nr:hypothetical protein [Phenylobacterium sp. SCN 70-31]ODT89211.1 MAG: hypothetical protein ABS78_03210 [Phenylobacterium sp. SCN 70-31]